MTNWALNGSFFFAIGLACLVLYIPGLDKFTKLPGIDAIHWVPGIPFGFGIFIFDEVRKCIIRRRPGGWVERETYY